MRRISDLFAGGELESEEERKDRKKQGLCIIRMILVVCFLCVIIHLLYWYSQQIDGEKHISSNDSLLFMGVEIEEDRIIKVSETHGLYNHEFGEGDLIIGFLTGNETIELLNSMYGLISDMKYLEEINKISEAVIPGGATYLSINKKRTNEFQYNAHFGGELDFDLLNMDVEVYSWKVDYKLHSGKETKEVYVAMIIDSNMLMGRVYKEGKLTYGMEVIQYRINE